MTTPLNVSLEDAIKMLYRAARFGAETLAEQAHGEEPVDVSCIEDTLADIDRLRFDAECSLNNIGLSTLVEEMKQEPHEGGES